MLIALHQVGSRDYTSMRKSLQPTGICILHVTFVIVSILL